jgi:hypothetical protein
MTGPISSIAWVVARCAPGASCPWWTSDTFPSPLFTSVGIIILAALVLFLNWVRRRS